MFDHLKGKKEDKKQLERLLESTEASLRQKITESQGNSTQNLTCLLKLDRLVEFVLESLDSCPLLARPFMARFGQRSLCKREIQSTEPLILLVRSFEVFMDLIIQAKNQKTKPNLRMTIPKENLDHFETLAYLNSSHGALTFQSKDEHFRSPNGRFVSGLNEESRIKTQKLEEISRKLGTSRSPSRSESSLAIKTVNSVPGIPNHLNSMCSSHLLPSLSPNELQEAPKNLRVIPKRLPSPKREAMSFNEGRRRSRTPLKSSANNSLTAGQEWVSNPIVYEKSHEKRMKSKESHERKPRAKWTKKLKEITGIGKRDPVFSDPQEKEPPRFEEPKESLENLKTSEELLERGTWDKKTLEEQQRQMKLMDVQGKYKDLSKNLENIQKELSSSAKNYRISSIAAKLLQNDSSSLLNGVPSGNSLTTSPGPLNRVITFQRGSHRESSPNDYSSKMMDHFETLNQIQQRLGRPDSPNKLPMKLVPETNRPALGLELPLPQKNNVIPEKQNEYSKGTGCLGDQNIGRRSWAHVDISKRRETEDQVVIESASSRINPVKSVSPEKKEGKAQSKSNERKPRSKNKAETQMGARSMTPQRGFSNSKSAEKSRDRHSAVWKDSITKNKTDRKLAELREQHESKEDQKAHYLGPMMDIDGISKKKRNNVKHLKDSFFL